MNRYFIGFLLAVGLIVVLIILIVHGGGSKSKVPNTSTTLESYASTDATVQMTIDGPINSNQKHNAVRITVGRASASYELLQGYDSNVVKSKSYGNTQSAYNAFLHALDHAGFTKGNNAANLKDESGYCPTGNRYIFELIQNGQDTERYWTTNCGGVPKSFLGSLNLNLFLFQNQIPDYNSLSQNVAL